MDGDHINLLLHLQKSPKELHPGVFYSLVQQLSTLPLPFTTTLTASVIASPAWDESNLTTLLLAFRQTFRSKVEKLLESSATGLSLAPSASWKLRGWLGSLCSGARVGPSRTRIAVLSGLIIGAEECKEQLNAGGARAKIEDELVVAVADYLGKTKPEDSWSSEFRGPRARNHESDIFLTLCSESLPLIQDRKLRLINLSKLVSVSLERISRYFNEGRILSHQSVKDDSRNTHSNLPRIARLASKAISALSNNPASAIKELVGSLEATTHLFEAMAAALEGDWVASELSRPTNRDGSTEETSLSSENIWATFKTFLFTTVMVLQSVVDSLLYTNISSIEFNAKLAGRIIKTLAHLSFISIEFGGLSAQGEVSFHEYKQTFYTALDIVLTAPSQGDALIQELSAHLKQLGEAGVPQGNPCLVAATVFYFHCSEQLIDQLSFQTLSQCVLPICKEYLAAPQQREAFESAHSVVLALFASQARPSIQEEERAELVRSMVPFYVLSLINCSSDDMLNIDQLRLAFASLVAGASASSSSDNGSIAWYCVESLLAKIHQLRTLQPRPEAQCNRLELALVSLLPSLSSQGGLLSKLLDNIENLIGEEERPMQRQLLLEAVREEILQRVSDVQRETVLRWWYDMLQRQAVEGEGRRVKPTIRAEL
ncbi:hypothetical protein FRC17_000303 [Serendipita sp. 399]|nr:hypothetical protein FRC17_000303 [Serendipita sp. 399]